MKPTYWILAMYVAVGCTATTSTETTSSDTTTSDTTTSITIDSAFTKKTSDVSLPEKPLLEISDSISKAVNDLVTAQFDSLFLALADSANYYRVAMTDYFDEWEGQNEGTHVIWYFDKSFNIVYSKHIHESGSMQGRDIKEYGLVNNSIAFATEETNSTDNYDDRVITLYNKEKGGVQFSKSFYTNKITSTKPLPDNYLNDAQYNWDGSLDELKDFIQNQPKENINKGNTIYTVLLEVPKPAELMDYTRVIIPKAVYTQLRSKENE